MLSLVKKQFPDILSAKFNTLRPALIEAHGQPGEAQGTGAGASGASTPAYAPAPPAKDAAAPKKEQKEQKKSVGETKTVEVEAELQASGEDLWGLLTEEGKIPMWSRSAAQVSGSPAVYSPAHDRRNPAEPR